MNIREQYEEKTEKLLEPIVSSFGYKTVDVEYVKEGPDFYLRAYIDKDGGITVDDCEKVSRRLEEELDKEDFIPNAYILEVSSPGLGRQLKKEKHFLGSIGEEVDIKLYEPFEGARELTAILKSYKDGIFEFETGEKVITVPLTSIAKINLHFDF